MFNIHQLRLRDLKPAVKMLTNQQAKDFLNQYSWKIQEIIISPGDETVWKGTIKFHRYPKAVLFEFDDLGRILKYMAVITAFVENGE